MAVPITSTHCLPLMWFWLAFILWGGIQTLKTGIFVILKSDHCSWCVNKFYTWSHFKIFIFCSFTLVHFCPKLFIKRPNFFLFWNFEHLPIRALLSYLNAQIENEPEKRRVFKRVWATIRWHVLTIELMKMPEKSTASQRLNAFSQHSIRQSWGGIQN